MKTVRTILASLVAALALCACAAPQKVPARTHAKQSAKSAQSLPRRAAPAVQLQTAHRRSPYVGAVCADATSGRILFADNADAEAYPASVTKLMTLFLVLEDVRARRYSLDDKVVATPDAYRCEPSWIGIKAGESMTVRDLCLALMVESANDAAIVLAVHSAGSFDAFVTRMNSRAASLGMSRTRYHNPNGLPPNAKRKYPWKSFNVSTAHDQLRLALALLKFPEALTFTSVKTCDLVKTSGGYRVSVTRRVNAPQSRTELAPGESVVKQMRNHNNVMVKDKQKVFNPDGKEAVDGFKTGYIDAGGSSVVITGSRGGRRAVAVVLGSSTSKERDDNAARLIADALGAIDW